MSFTSAPMPMSTSSLTAPTATATPSATSAVPLAQQPHVPPPPQDEPPTKRARMTSDQLIPEKEFLAQNPVRVDVNRGHVLRWVLDRNGVREQVTLCRRTCNSVCPYLCALARVVCLDRLRSEGVGAPGRALHPMEFQRPVPLVRVQTYRYGTNPSRTNTFANTRPCVRTPESCTCILVSGLKFDRCLSRVLIGVCVLVFVVGVSQGQAQRQVGRHASGQDEGAHTHYACARCPGEHILSHLPSTHTHTPGVRVRSDIHVFILFFVCLCSDQRVGRSFLEQGRDVACWLQHPHWHNATGRCQGARWQEKVTRTCRFFLFSVQFLQLFQSRIYEQLPRIRDAATALMPCQG